MSRLLRELLLWPFRKKVRGTRSKPARLHGPRKQVTGAKKGPWRQVEGVSLR